MCSSGTGIVRGSVVSLANEQLPLETTGAAPPVSGTLLGEAMRLLTRRKDSSIIQWLNSRAESKGAMANREETGELRELELLEALAEDPEARQVDLATRLGVAVGTVNWLLKRLVTKGYVKVRRIGRWRWRYLVTPRGFAEKARLTQQYLQSSMRIYRQTREEATRLLRTLRKGGYTRVRLEGDINSDLGDICRLTCLEQKITMVNSRRNVGEDKVPALRVAGRKLSVEWPKDTTVSEQRDGGGTGTDQELSEVIRRIVEVAQPEKIILFGSAVRGEVGPNSDLDLLVIKSGVHRRHLAQRIYRNLIGVGQAVDIVVATPEDLVRYGDSIGLVYKPALREGKVVYERDAKIA